MSSIYHSPDFGIPQDDPVAKRAAAAVEEARRYFTPGERDAFEQGFKASENHIYKTRRSTIAAHILDATFWLLALYMVLNLAVQVGGFVSDVSADDQHKATIARLEAQLAAIDKRLGIEKPEMTIRMKGDAK
jgi:hypothetical protein